MKHLDKYAELTGKRLTGEITPEEERELSDWLKADGENQLYAEELEEIWKLSESANAEPFNTDMTQAWANIDAALSGGGSMGAMPSAKIVPLSKRLGRWSMAAAILALLAVGVWWMNHDGSSPATYVEVQTGEGERKEIVLPDGSEITLNENTRLSYTEKFTERNVSLIGEAFFDVERMEDRPFTISSDHVTTTVLGTSFNVRAYPNEKEVEVTVKSGKVALAVAEKKSSRVILEAGTAGVVEKATATVIKVEADHVNADAWKTMRLEFDDVLMRDVISTLERYFDTEIEVSNELIFECTYTSEFTKPDLNEILTVISMTIGAEFEEDGKVYRINGEGCNPDN